MQENGECFPKEAIAIFDSLHLTEEVQREIMAILNRSMDRGLRPNVKDKNALKMLPSYVRALPNGTERGSFIALDMGGSNFRVLFAEFTDEGLRIEVDKFHLSDEYLTGNSDQFFDYIAEQIATFVKKHRLDSTCNELPMGFTFSFPCAQHGLASGDLIIWTKGFAVDGVVGKDVVALLQEALDRKNIKVRTVALLNDTVGVLVAGAYYNNSCEIGLIVGTGINAAYMEQLSNVGKWTGDQDEPRQVAINMELGGFGDDGVIDFMRTEFDYQLDKQTVNEGCQRFEKMVSGKYLGEVARLILAKLTRLGVALDGQLPAALEEEWIFTTSLVAEIVDGDTDVEHTHSRRILQSFGVVDPLPTDCRLLHAICVHVARRSATLAAVIVAGLLARLKKPRLGIAVEGTMYKEFPTFRQWMMERIAVLSPDYKADFTHVEDGSGKGAAVLAAVVARMKEDKSQ